MPSEELTLRPATPDDLDQVAEVFLASRAAADMPPVQDPVGARRWVEGWDLTERETWLAEDATGPVAFAVLQQDWLDALYVVPGSSRSGVGSALLDLVKSLRPDGFALWVFESNVPARSFYAGHGLVELEHTDGSENMERSPDLRMAWLGADPSAYLRGQLDEVDRSLASLQDRRDALVAALATV
jgi:GNAT superfamily N-acetyltransferase